MMARRLVVAVLTVVALAAPGRSRLVAPVSTAPGPGPVERQRVETGAAGEGKTRQAEGGSLAAAEALLPSGGTLVVTGIVAVPETRTTPANIRINVQQGGGFNLAAGTRLTFGGPFEAGLHQVFFGSGSAAFQRGTVKSVYAGWWYGGSGAWDSALASAVGACSSAVVWCELPPVVNTVGAVSAPSNTWLRPVAEAGGILAAAGYGTLWTHAPSTAGVSTIVSSSSSNVRVEGIFFATADSNGHYPAAALYLSSVIGCRVRGIGTANRYEVAALLNSGLQDCRMDDLEISGTMSGTPTPAGIRFLGPGSSPAGKLSTTVDVSHLTMSGGTNVGVVFDGGACLGCNFYSPEVESQLQTAFNIGKGNTVDLYSPYVEAVPVKDGPYAIFRIGQDYLGASYATYVHIFGGEVYGTNGRATQSLAFDLGPGFGQVTIKGGQYGRVNSFQNIASACPACKLTVDSVSASLTSGFGPVAPENAHQVDFREGNYFTCGGGPGECVPSASRQFGAAAFAPTRFNSPGQFYWSTDRGLLVWNGTAWVQANAVR